MPQIEPQDEISEFFVNEDLAKTVAENFMRKTKPSLKSTQNYKLEKINDEMGEELIYVINFDEGGFVLMPADNRIEPILAFSDNNYFKTENVENKNGIGLWISNTKNGIKKTKKSKEPQSEEVKELWKKHLDFFNLKDEGDPPDDPCVESHDTKGPLLSTSKDGWGQAYYFNQYCPTEAEVEATCGSCDCDFSELSFGRAYTGCIPVAMGMIMSYHEYPTSYSWSQMPDFPGNAIASDLLFDIGSAVDISYECTGSPADESDVTGAFESTFGYSTTATLMSYSTSSLSNYGTVRAEIIADRPVLFMGYVSSGQPGHAWVCDGYRISIYCIGDTEYEYRFLNMRWGDGDAMGDGEFSYNSFGYSYNLSIVKGIEP